ncbi:hypothetical protein O3M35_010457 [Rhynocoris fuscipes]|uniref:Uncharacterized protein n=1 Tax=Rhynocoris fuscipes TaxID=488301 RepID=A0AAW1CYY1_9HEMI
MAESEESISVSVCDEILMNEVNNIDVKLKVDLNDLFTRIGPIKDFLRQPGPEVVVEEIPFDMGYEDILINQVNNVEVPMEEALDDLFTEIGPKEDFLLAKAVKPTSEYPLGYAMSPNRPPPFRIGSDDVLINEVNNVDVRIDTNLDDLFTEIGPTVDIQVPKKHKPKTEESYPQGYSMSPDNPPPFDMGHEDILINTANNRDVRMDKNLDDLFTKIGRRLDFTPPPKKKTIEIPPFDMGYNDILINEVNNRDVIVKGELDELFTKIGPREDFILAKAVLQTDKYPPGYAMSPDNPPPFDMGYDDILINEANNIDVRMDEDLFDLLFPIIGRRHDFKKRRKCKT